MVDGTLKAQVEKMEMWGTGHGEKREWKWRSLDLVQEVFWPCTTMFGPKLTNCCKAEKRDTQEDGKMSRIILFEEVRVHAKKKGYLKGT